MQSQPMGNLASLGFRVGGPVTPIPAPLPPNVKHISDVVANKPIPVPCYWEKIPAELKALKQWVSWKYELRDGKKWDKVPYSPVTNIHASSIDPATWCSFEDAVRFSGIYDGIGMVLVESNGLVIIDLDNKANEPATAEELAFFTEMVVNFATYTELSVSGRGAHIVCGGTLPDGLKGRRVGHIEVYAAERYLTFTGNTDLSGLSFVPSDIEAVPTVQGCQKELTYLMSKLGQSKGAATAYSDAEIDVLQTKSIEEIWLACSVAENKEKFMALWNMDWNAIGHHDHSQADMQLMEFFRFAGATMQQCVELHKLSGLSCDKRTDKKKHHSYPMRTARKVFAIGFQEKESARLMQEQAKAFMTSFMEQQAQQEHKFNESFVLDYPPGQLGDLARMFYSQSHLPNQQISIVAALAYMAGIAGLNWQTPTRAGLNINVVIVAPSGLGKEAATTLPFKLFKDTRTEFVLPDMENPFLSGSLASGQAMFQVLAERRCVVKHWNEIGRLFKSWGSDKDSISTGIKNFILAVYTKSGRDTSLGSMEYADKLKKIEDPGPCSFSIVGDVTGDELYPSIEAGMATDGGLSRIDFVQAFGDRPRLNTNALHPPTKDVLDWSRSVVSQSGLLRNTEQYTFCSYADEAAYNLMDAFGEKCRLLLKGMAEGFVRQSYTRGHLRALKFASLCAVADNPYAPVITTAHATWAIQFVEGVIAMFEERVEAGDVGTGEDSRINRVVTMIKAYYAKRPMYLGNGITDKMWEHKLISTSYLSRGCGNYAAFKNQPVTPSAVLKQTLEHMASCGMLHPLDKAELAMLGFPPKSLLYRVLSLD